MMHFYILKRLLLIIPTLFVIIALNFAVVQILPGGPVERMVAKLRGIDTHGGDVASMSSGGRYMASQGLAPELIEQIKVQYGFDKPPLERFTLMLKNYLTFNFGESYYRNISVIDLIKEKLPVSISLGLWSTLLIYFIAIPLGIKKAIRHGERFDSMTNFLVVLSFAIPSFLLAVIFLLVFGVEGPLGYFPIRSLTSSNFEELSFFGKITDYIWHITLPTLAITLTGFATLVILTKNSFLEEITKNYVVTAKAKGLSENQIMYKHVFRNAMLLVIASIPDAIIKILFTGTLLIEIIFSLDGLGLLGYEAAIGRDYPVVFGILYIFTLIGLVINIITDLTYVLIDPRINFENIND